MSSPIVPPPGYKSGQTRAPLLWNIVLPLTVVALILACLRLYVRARLVRVVGKDDWLLLAAVICLCFHCGTALWTLRLGLGRHQYDLSDFDPQKLVPFTILGSVFYYASLCCVQCSILCFYLRIGIQQTGGKHMRHLIYAIMCFSILNNVIAATLQSVFTTVPSMLAQSPKYFAKLYLICGPLNLFTDILIWCIPLPSVYPVVHSLSSRKKVLLVLVFAIGILSWCSSILRIAWRGYVVDMGSDTSYNGPIVIVLYTTEITLAIACVSLVTLRPLVVKITKGFNRLRGKQSTSSSRSRSSGHQFGATPQPTKFEFGPSGSRTTNTTGRVGTYTAVGEQLMVLKDHGTVIQNSQLVQHTCGCPCEDEDVEFGSVVAPTSPCPRCLGPVPDTKLQVPALAATGHPSTKSRSSRQTQRTTAIGGTSQSIAYRPPIDALPSSESMVNLTNINTNPTTCDPRTRF